MAAASSAAGVQKSLDRINAQVAAGAFYEAQQMYKTVYHRYMSRKQLPDSYLVLQAGAVQQLSSHQINCGMELGGMLLDAYSEGNVPATDATLGSVLAILQALPQPLQLADPDSTSELEETSRFVMAALKWANKQGAGAGVQRIHDTYAAWIFAAFGWRQFSKAALHFSRGADAQAYAAAIADVSSQAAGGQEADLFVTRAVLQTLACAHTATKDRQLSHAADLLQACKQQLPSTADAPLLHFCGLLLQALALRKPALVTLLQSRYQPSLELDPSFDAFVSTIEQTYFNISPAGAGGGLLGGLLKSLLEGDELGGE